ncbi:hypothetical protein ACFL1B_02370 [Nanoarchaeota archaeon]
MTKATQLQVLLIALLGALAILAPYAFSQTGSAANYRNVTIRTTVNITNSVPIVETVTMLTVTLTAGTFKEIQCNATVTDFDGIGTLVNVNATLFDTTEANMTSANDNNNRYSNSSCVQTSASSITGNYTCSFNVYYYANNGTTWNCTVKATDDQTTTGNYSTAATVLALLALNVTPDTIDFGNMAVGDISSSSVEANVTNFGNIQINLSVRGFGETSGDGLAMKCSQNNITIGNERFDVNASMPWASMNALDGTTQEVSGFSVIQRTDDAPGGETINSTYWTLRVPVSDNPSGQCNGSLVFQAEAN